jgi:hypothetical protein
MKSTERARVKKMIARNDKAQPADLTWRPKSTATRKSVTQILGQQDGMKALKREFDALTAKATAQAEAQAVRQHKSAVAASRKRAAAHKALASGRIKGLQSVGDFDNLASDTPRFLLQTPFEISLVGANLTEHRIQSGNSFARFGFVFGSGRNGAVRAHFSYVWQNPTDKFVLINAHGYIIFDGFIEVGVNGGFWPGDRSASVAVQAFMGVHDFGEAPLLPSAFSFTETAAALSESDGGFGAVGAIANKDVFRGFDLDTSLYIVKPRGTIGLVLAANFPFGTGEDGGRVVGDFEQGGHRVTSPACLIQIVS